MIRNALLFVEGIFFVVVVVVVDIVKHRDQMQLAMDRDLVDEAMKLRNQRQTCRATLAQWAHQEQLLNEYTKKQKQKTKCD